MKIKYRDETLNPNRSKCCIDCAISKYVGLNESCVGLCYRAHVYGGFNKINNYEVLEL